MDAHARRRFARHLLLAEVGERGQASLCAQTVRVAGDARAVEVAAMYLERAGIIVVGAPSNANLASPPLPLAGGAGSASGAAHTERNPPPNPLPRAGGGERAHAGGEDRAHAAAELHVGSPDAVAALAGRAELEHAAAFVAGAFAAVEAIKRALDVGQPGQLDGIALSGPEDV